jgi:hypothetical protein
MTAVIKRIDPPLPLLTPKGKASAYFLIDPSIDHNLQWVTFHDETGECWTWQNKDIRLQSNVTMGRLYSASLRTDEQQDTVDDGG